MDRVNNKTIFSNTRYVLMSATFTGPCHSAPAQQHPLKVSLNFAGSEVSSRYKCTERNTSSIPIIKHYLIIFYPCAAV